MKEHLDSARRTLTMTRLEMGKLCTFLGRDPWEKVANTAYESACDTSVTVIITLFNYSEYIYECLDSVCASKSADLPGGFEVLVIDDCSTDSSANRVEQYIQKTDVPICLVKKLFNTGLADARNIGLQLARSPYVFMLDADNWIYPNCLSKMYEILCESEYASVYGIINTFDNKTREARGLISSYEWDVHELVRAPYIDAMAMFCRDVLLQLGGYSTELMEIGWYGWEDYDMWLKIAQAGYSCKCLPQVLSSYRLHPHSMISTTKSYSLFIARYLIKKYADLAEKYDSEGFYLFGVPRDELLGLHAPMPDLVPAIIDSSANAHAQELQVLREKLQRARANVKHKKEALEQAHERISAMETSKFWQLRKAWFRLKRLFMSPGQE